MERESKPLLEVVRLRYWKRREAEIVIAAWRESGESLAAFARRWSIKAKRIGRWVARLEGRCAREIRLAHDEASHGVEDEQATAARQEQGDEASMPFHPVCLVEPPTCVPSRSAGSELALLAELVREQWTVRVPLGFEAGEMARLLEVVTQVEQC